MAMHPTASLWPDAVAMCSRLEDLRSRSVSKCVDLLPEPRLRAAEAALEKFVKAVAAERSSLTQAEGNANDEDFWARYAELEADEAAATVKLHNLKACRYFPIATYRLGAPGLYMGMSDFWISQLSANFEMQCTPAAGDVWAMPASGLPHTGSAAGPRPATVLLRLRPLTLALQIDDLGLRGDSVPSPLRSIRQLQLTLDLDVCVPLLFAPPTRANSAGTTASGSAAPGAAGSTGASRGTAAAPAHPLDRLLTFRWQAAPAPAFRCEVTRLECRTKGLSIPLPNTLLRWAINALIPSRLRDALTAAVPQELGVLLSLHRSGDHAFRCAGRAGVFSLPLDALSAPLEGAVDVRPPLWTSPTQPAAAPALQPPAVGDKLASAAAAATSSAPSSRRSSVCEAGSDVRAGSTGASAPPVPERLRPRSRAYHAGRGGSPRRAAAGLSGALRASLAHAGAAAGAATSPTEQQRVYVVAPGAPLTLAQMHATWGAASLGLTAQQARCFIAAQTGAAVAAGAKPSPLFKSAHDLMRFVALHSPHSRARAMQAEAQAEAAAELAEAERLAAAFLVPATSAAAGAAGGAGASSGTFASWWGGTGGASSAPPTSSPLAPPTAVPLTDTAAVAAAAEAEAATYARALSALQALLDTHVDAQAGGLLERASAAASAGDKADARRLAAAAASVAEHSAIDAKALAAAAERLNLKPLRLHVQVTELSAATHAQTAVGLVKTVLLRLLQERRDSVLGSSAGRGASASGTGARVTDLSGAAAGTARGPPSPSSQRMAVLSARSAAAAKAASSVAAAATKAAAGKAAAGLQAGARAMGTSIAAGLRKGSALAMPAAEGSSGGSLMQTAPAASAAVAPAVASAASGSAAAASKKGGFFSSLWSSGSGPGTSSAAAAPAASTSASTVVGSAATGVTSAAAPASTAAIGLTSPAASPGLLSSPPEGVTALSFAAFAPSPPLGDRAPSTSASPVVPARSASLAEAAAGNSAPAWAVPPRSVSLSAALAPGARDEKAAPAGIASGATGAAALSADDIAVIAADAAAALVADTPASSRPEVASAPSTSHALAASSGAASAFGGDDSASGSSQPRGERRSSFGSVGASSAATPAALGAVLSSSGSTTGGAAAGASLAAQAERVQDWAAEASASAAAVTGLVSRISASVCASVCGGARGQLAGAVRQLQVELQPGMRMPVPLPEGIFPPSAMITALETAEERSEALGWRRSDQHAAAAAASAASGSGGTTSAGVGIGTGSGGRTPGFGMLSMMLAFPREQSEDPVAAAAAVAAAASAPVPSHAAAPSAFDPSPRGRTGSSRGAGEPRGSSASEMLRRESSLGSISSLQASPAYSAAQADAAPAAQTIGGGVKSLALAATLRVHRLWAGLRVDEDALLELLLRRRAIAAAARSAWTSLPQSGLNALVDGRYRFPLQLAGAPPAHLPPLHVLELDLRPVAAAGAHGPGLDTSAVERLAAQRPERDLAALHAGCAGLAGDGAIAVSNGSGSSAATAGSAMTGLAEEAVAAVFPPLPPAAPYALSVDTAPWTRFVAEAAALEARGELDTVVEQLRSIISGLWTAARAEQAREIRAGSAADDDESEQVMKMSKASKVADAAAAAPLPLVADVVARLRRYVASEQLHLTTNIVLLAAAAAPLVLPTPPIFFAGTRASAAAGGVRGEQLLPDARVCDVGGVSSSADDVAPAAGLSDKAQQQKQLQLQRSLFLSLSSIAVSSSPVAQPFQPSLIPPAGSAAAAAQAVEALELVSAAPPPATPASAPAKMPASSSMPAIFDGAPTALPTPTFTASPVPVQLLQGPAVPVPGALSSRQPSGVQLASMVPLSDAGADANPFGGPSPTPSPAAATAPASSAATAPAHSSSLAGDAAGLGGAVPPASSRSRASSAAAAVPPFSGAMPSAAAATVSAPAGSTGGGGGSGSSFSVGAQVASSPTTGSASSGSSAALPPRPPVHSTSAGSAPLPTAAVLAGMPTAAGPPPSSFDSLPPLTAPALSLDVEVQLLQLLDDWQALSRVLSGPA